MSTGDVVSTKRVRFESSERFDLVDALGLSGTARVLADALGRAVLITPLATAAAPVGLILTGGSVAVNPTSGADGLLRLNTELFVGVDADGRFVVKPAGTTATVAIPAGGSPYQIYVCFQEDLADQAKRRRIPVSPPFIEFSFTPYTTFESSYTLVVRNGGTGSIVPSAVVNGVTTALIFLGIASNVAGAVTFTPADNRLSTVVKPSAVPASSSVNGSMRTLDDMSNVALYEVGRAKFSSQGGLSGSAASIGTGATAVLMRVSGLVGMSTTLVGSFLKISGTTTPANSGVFLIKGYVSSTTVDVFNESSSFTDASNGSVVWSVLAHVLPDATGAPDASTNFGAYADPRRGVDEVDRSGAGFVTIGDGSSQFGTFDRSEFASDDLCLQAAVDAIVAYGGGTVLIKPGVVLDNFAADVTLADGTLASTVDVTIQGSEILNPQLDMAGFKIVAGPSTFLTLRKLHVLGTGTVISVQGDFEAHDSVLESTPSNAALVAVSGSSTTYILRFFNCRFLSLPASNDNTISAFVDVGVGAFAGGATALFHGCRFEINTYARCGVRVDLGTTAQLKVSDCVFMFVANVADLGAGNYPALFRLDDSTSSRGAQFVNCSFRGSAAPANASNAVGVDIYDSTGVTFADCVFDHCRYGVAFRTASLSPLSTRHRISNCRFVNDDATNATPNFGILWDQVAAADSSVVGCFFSNSSCEIAAQLGAGYDIESFTVNGCTFLDSRLQILGNNVGSLLVQGNSFRSTGSLAGSYILCPTISANTTNGRVMGSYVGNSHHGYSSTLDSSLALGVSFQAHTLEVTVSENVFREIQFGITYAGSTSAVPNVVVLFQAKSHRWIVSGNHFQRLGITSTGVNFQEITCVHATTTTGAAVSGCVLDSCLLMSNRFGGDGEPNAVLRVGSGASTVVLGVKLLRISGNVQIAPGTVLTSTQAGGYGWKISLDATVGVNTALDVHGNTWYVEGSGVGDWFTLSGAGTLRGFAFCDNSIAAGGAFASNKGLHSDATHTLVTFKDNAAFVEGSIVNPTFFTDITNLAASAINPSDPTAGGTWSDNLGIKNVTG